jgi:hypothetical protein
MAWHQEQKPATDKPADDKAASDKATADKPAAQQPAAEKPGTEKPGAEKPAEKAEQPLVPAQPAPVAPVPVVPVPPAPAPVGGGPRAGQILEPALWLVGTLLLGAFVIAMLKRAQQVGGLHGDSAHDQLAQFREAHDQGEMTDEEYKRVKALLTTKIKDAEMKAAAEGGATPAPAPPGPTQGPSADGAGRS